jgi:AFG3 family protein
MNLDAGWKNFPKPKATEKSKESSGEKGSREAEWESVKKDLSDKKKTNKENKDSFKKDDDGDSKKDNEEEESEESESDGPSGRVLGLIFIGTIGVLAFLHWYSREDCVEIYYQQFVTDLLKEDLVDKLEVVNGERVRVYLRGRSLGLENASYYFNIPSVESFERRLDEVSAELGIEVPPVKYAVQTNLFHATLAAMPTLLWIGFFGWMALIMTKHFNGVVRKMGGMGGSGGPGGIFNIGKSRAKRFTKSKLSVQFKDVAGCDEAKVEIQEFVNFLKNPQKYQELGAKIPKGALLVGPPGTGKTLLAKATAGEANVPFYSVAGSDFLEMFVGVGPSRVRDLFAQARESAPCIIFIDEIDAIGRQRGGRGGGSNDERENTLNQLLVEMDGFSTSKKPIVVLAGTNRHDILDKALLRPGRFDRTISLDLPDIKARKDIFMVHLPKLKLEHVPEYYAGKLAAMTPGFSGADVANLCNEAALIAARKESTHVKYEHFESSVERVVAGLERRSMAMSKLEKRTVAYHEAGHATVSWFLEHGSPLLKVSIIPRGPGLGYAMYIPEEQHLYTKQKLIDTICVTLGGRAAEELTFGSITSGAQDDLEKVTNIAYSQLLEYGMSETLGPATFGSLKDQGHVSKNYSEETAALIDREVRELVDTAYARTKSIISEHKDLFDRLAETLIEKEVLSYDDCKEILGERPFPPSAIHAEYLKMKEELSKEKL